MLRKSDLSLFFSLWCFQWSSDASSISIRLFAFPLLSHTNVSYPMKHNSFPFVLHFSSSPCASLCSAVSRHHSPSYCPPPPHITGVPGPPCSPSQPTSTWVSSCSTSSRYCFFPPHFPYVFPNAALLACSVWLAGSRVRLKCQSNFFFLPVLKGCHEMEFEHQKIQFCWERFKPAVSK